MRSEDFGLPMSVFDIAPTILNIYGISAPAQMKGRVLSEIFASEA
jgi:bisphosphoglycerate-independent phosphoglycerate mutase (AlkP superfamily)